MSPKIFPNNVTECYCKCSEVAVVIRRQTYIAFQHYSFGYIRDILRDMSLITNTYQKEIMLQRPFISHIKANCFQEEENFCITTSHV